MKRAHFIAVLLILSLSISFGITAATAQDGVTLTMWTWKQFHIPGLEAVGQAFTEQTGINVEFQVFNPDDAYRTRIQAASQSGDLPDILAYWSGSQWDMAASGLLNPLEVSDNWAAQFLPGTFDTTSVWTQDRFDSCATDSSCLRSNIQVGDVYSVPLAAGSFYIVFANKSMLEAAGLDPSVIPADTNEFLDMMQAVHEATGFGATIGGKSQDITRNWIVNALAVTSCGPEAYAGMLNGDPSVSFTNDCAAEAYKFIGDMAERDLWMPGFQTLTIDQADVAFANGEAAFDFGGSFTLGFLLQQGMDPENIVTFTLPALPSSQQAPIELAPFALIDLMVTANSAHPAEAQQFIEFFVSPEQMATFARITGDLPAINITDDPAVVGDLMSGMVQSYANADQSLLAGWNNNVVAGDDVWLATDNITNMQITGEAALPDLLQWADDAARADVTRRATG